MLRVQRGLARVWERFTYSSLALAEVRRRCGGGGDGSGARAEPGCGAKGGGPAYLRDPRLTGRDAVDTLMQVLKARLVQRRAQERREPPEADACARAARPFTR